MKSMGLYGKRRKSKYKSYKGEIGKIAPNILNREFETDKPYSKLVTDVTEFSICKDKVPILDLYNNEIISYSISQSPSFAQTREMLEGLFEKLPKTARPILHSNQGWQYQSRLKVEMYYEEKFRTVDEFVHCPEECIHYWNNDRISLTLKGMSPVQYRTHTQID